MIKSKKEIEKMKVAGQLAAETLEMIDQYVKEGVSTGELDDICHDFIVNEINCIPACLNYKGYPKTICTSINQVICHGIPDHKKILKDGDIMNIDVTVIKDGYHGDTSKMYFIGNKKPVSSYFFAFIIFSYAKTLKFFTTTTTTNWTLKNFTSTHHSR